MAMLASKSPYQAPLLSASSNLSNSAPLSSVPSSRRTPAAMAPAGQSFGSPTESEFSDTDGPESAKNWDEDRVCEWLRSVKCGDYEKLFKKNNINGENLLEMDKAVLQEIGIEKIGDRVRLFLAIKKLRTKAYANQKKRNRVSQTQWDLLRVPLLTIFSRTPLLAWTCTPLPAPDLHDIQMLAVERLLPRLLLPRGTASPDHLDITSICTQIVLTLS